MEHLQLIINLIAINTGLAALASSIAFFVKTKRREYFYRTLVILSFMCILVPFLIVNYLFNIKAGLVPQRWIGPDLGIIFLIPGLAAYAGEVAETRFRKRINVAAVLFGSLQLLLYIVETALRSSSLVPLIIRCVGLSLAIAYCGSVFLFCKFGNAAKAVRICRKIIGTLALLFLPLFITVDILRAVNVFDMLHISQTVVAVPLFFSLWSLFFVSEDAATLARKKQGNGYEAFCRHHSLTPRESETGALLVKGLTYEEIAESLFVSRETVKSHIKSIYQKTDVGNKVQLIMKINGFTQGAFKITALKAR